MSNQKYEITGIAHEKYPFLHRIRALRDIGKDVKTGDLGGYVEHEGNLSFAPGDDAWLYDEAIAAGESVVDKGSVLRKRAVICGSAYASHGSVLFGDAVVISGEEVCNSTPDGLILDGKTRTVVRPAGRDVLRPRQLEEAEEKKKTKHREAAR